MKKITILIFVAFQIAKAQTWSSVGTGMNSWVMALTLYNGDLYAGGAFTLAGGNSASGVAEWDGVNWLNLGTGINGAIAAMAVYNTELCVGGTFSLAGGNSASGIAKWNGSTWSNLGAGMLHMPNWDDGYVYALTTDNNYLYAGGQFISNGSGSWVNMAQWDGTSWASLNTGMSTIEIVTSVCLYNNELYAGGTFGSAGGTPVYNIAKWNGAR